MQTLILTTLAVIVLQGIVPEKPKTTTTVQIINGVQYVTSTTKAL